MIPKIVHYCWFGHGEKTVLMQKCINSWKKYCPDYEIIEWNESNYDISKAPLFVRQAYENKKWAYVTDYVRLDIVYRFGGLYFDTDVEIIKNIDFLLNDKAFFALEENSFVNTGLGFGAEKDCYILKKIMGQYEKISFIKYNSSLNLISAPVLNTEVFKEEGFVFPIDRVTTLNDVTIYPSEYFAPMNYDTQKIKKTKNTYSIHRYSASWFTEEEQNNRKNDLKKYKKSRVVSVIRKALFCLFGEKFIKGLWKKIRWKK